MRPNLEYDMTPLERDLVNLVKLARRKDIRPQFVAMRELHGAETVTAKLYQCFSEDGANELLTWLAQDDAPSNDPQIVITPEVKAPQDQFTIAGAVGYYKGRKETPALAIIDKEMRSARIDGGKVWLDYEKLNGWRVDRGEKDLDGHVCIAFMADNGELIAGRFDHKKVGQTVKTLANIGAGIISANGRSYQPRKGQEVGFFILDRTGKVRTNTVKTAWK